MNERFDKISIDTLMIQLLLERKKERFNKITVDMLTGYTYCVSLIAAQILLQGFVIV